MARVTYQASANNKPWSPNLTPDTSDRILKQSEDYIQKLKAARDFQAAQDAQFITEYTASIDRGIESQRQVDLEQERQARALASYKQSQLRDQAARAKSVGGSITGDDNKTMQWLNFVVKASETAFETYGEISEIKAEQDKQFVAEIRARYPTTFQKIGEDIQLGGSRIAGQRIEAAAAQAELNGDLEQAETLRSLNAGQTAEFTRLSMIDAGRLMPTHFQRDIYSQTSLMDVVIDGEKRPLNSIRTADDMRQAYPQYRNAWMKANGFGDIDNRLYTDGLAESQKGFERVIAATRQTELQASKANRLDQARTAFRIKFTNPDTAQAAVQDFFMSVFNHNGGNRADARAQLLKEATAANLPEESRQALIRTVLPGMDKPIGTYVDADGKTVTGLYDQEIATMRQNVLRNAQNIQNEFDVQQGIEFEKSARLAQEAYLEDFKEDGTINEIDEDQLKARIAELTRLGPAAKAELDVHKRWAPHLSSVQNDKRLDEEFQFFYEQGDLRDDTILNSTGSTEFKRKWLKLNAEKAAESLTESEVTSFQGIARSMMMERTKETPGANNASNMSNTRRAMLRATADFRNDYMLALRDGKSKFEAFNYAEGRFNDRFEDAENGLYKVSGLTKTADGKIKPGVLVNFGPQVAAEISEPSVHLGKLIDKYGKNLLNATESLVSDEVAERMNDDITNNRRMTVIPQPILMIAQATKKPVIEVANAVLMRKGYEPMAPYITETVQQTEASISPEWQNFFRNRPGKTSYESADAALIGSGQEPIYNQRIPAAVRHDVDFQRGVYGMSQRLGVSVGDLYAIMDFETGGTFDPAQRNAAGSGATGLIQFMPNTAAGLGTSTDQLASMSRVQQLQYVEQYFRETGVKPGASLSDLYMAVLFPAAVGKSDDFVLFGNGAMSGFGGRAYDQNSGLDKDGNGAVTKGEATRKMLGSKNVWRETRNLTSAVKSAQVTGYFKFDDDGNKIPAN